MNKSTFEQALLGALEGIFIMSCVGAFSVIGAVIIMHIIGAPL
jgi:hypothetical protein